MDTISAADTGWILTSSALVLLMTPGLAFFYGGLVRGQSVLNTMMMSVIAMGIGALCWVALGYSIAFGEGGAWFGSFEHLGLRGVEGVEDGLAIPAILFAMFQMTFAIITPALISGAVVERMRFSAYVLFIMLWSIVCYAPLCHWVWGGGWIGAWGVLDFAGGTVVHISAGVSAVVCAIMLGRRSTQEAEARPHNVPFVLLGGGLLWFGWFGFNGGSALAADETAAMAVMTTTLAAAAAMMAWTTLEWRQRRRPSAVGAMIGAVVGLVTITPAAGFVSPMGAIAMGVLGSAAAFYAIILFAKSGIDDSLDVFACHGVGGLVGSVLTGVFALEGGLLYGGGFELLMKQTVGALAGGLWAAIVTVGIFVFLRSVMRVRVLEDQEESGLDLPVHGEEAYA